MTAGPATDPAIQLRPVSTQSRAMLAALVLGLPLLSLVILPTLGIADPGAVDRTPAWALPGAAAFCVALAVALDWGLRRHRIALDASALEVTTSFYRRRVALGDLRIDQARVADLDERTELRPALKTNGTGLPGFKSGWFRLRNGNKALVATVGGRRALWLPTRLGYDLLLEPVRPQALLDRLRELAAPKPGR